jgi:FkbM family methyltransferase
MTEQWSEADPTYLTIRYRDRDLRICGRPDDPYVRRLAEGDAADRFLFRVAESFLREDAVIFDVGANIGVTSAILATRARRGKVHSFEPSPVAFPLLEATVKANALATCTPHRLGCGAQAGELPFFDNPDSASASHLSSAGRTLGGHNCRIPCTTIDSFVAENRIERLDLVKIDVEGFELDVLAGARRTIAGLRPGVFLEFNSFTLIAFGNENPRHVLEVLLDTFPHVYRLAGGELSEIRSEQSVLDFIHDNLIKPGCVDDLYCRHERIA